MCIRDRSFYSPRGSIPHPNMSRKSSRATNRDTDLFLEHYLSHRLPKTLIESKLADLRRTESQTLRALREKGKGFELLLHQELFGATLRVFYKSSLTASKSLLSKVKVELVLAAEKSFIESEILPSPKKSHHIYEDFADSADFIREVMVIRLKGSTPDDQSYLCLVFERRELSPTETLFILSDLPSCVPTLHFSGTWLLEDCSSNEEGPKCKLTCSFEIARDDAPASITVSKLFIASFLKRIVEKLTDKIIPT
eukprot:TRINITY_DN733_c0_g1_i6.p1 TRINITY_DN733_c0_g1~~TRINITY_DN733_c0_g1_i6.p1  ORF type:complete len:253 (-),score=14.92 TRINITY_DN733_c0_g1_i6:93-851(-)